QLLCGFNRSVVVDAIKQNRVSDMAVVSHDVNPVIGHLRLPAAGSHTDHPFTRIAFGLSVPRRTLLHGNRTLGLKTSDFVNRGAARLIRVVGPSLIAALALKHAQGVIPSSIEHPLDDLGLGTA